MCQEKEGESIRMMYFTKTHEWVKVEGDMAKVGITDHAQEKMSDIVYVELPDVETPLKKEERFMAVESVKAASDIYAPASGVVTKVNESLSEGPEVINESPEQEGWLIVMKLDNPDELQSLLTREAYAALLSAK